MRILYLQKDVKDHVLEMLFGAMAELRLGDPWHPSTDVGPVIDDQAKRDISEYCERMEREGRLLYKPDAPGDGWFVVPAVFGVSGIEELDREIFGPVLHVADFEADEIDGVVDAVNRKGYGLTFGLHTRVDSRVQRVVDRLKAGNLYVNRNQIGAAVGSQPFGGEGLSGTGPKAGGSHILPRLRRTEAETWSGMPSPIDAPHLSPATVQAAFGDLDPADWSGRGDRVGALRTALTSMRGLGSLPGKALDAAEHLHAGPLDLPGPTGESKRLSCHPRGTILCLGPSAEAALVQGLQALVVGGAAVLIAPNIEAVIGPVLDTGAPLAALNGGLEPAALRSLAGFAAAASAAEAPILRLMRVALAVREGDIVPLITEAIAPHRYVVERHLCVDTTAAGGNASLLAATGS